MVSSGDNQRLKKPKTGKLKVSECTSILNIKILWYLNFYCICFGIEAVSVPSYAFLVNSPLSSSWPILQN